VLIWADLARAALLGSIPVAAAGGWLTLAQVYAVATLAAVCTTFFDLADRAYLPTIVPRSELLRANGALSATSAAVEFAGFGAAGVLVTVLTAPIAILIDAVSFVVSAVILGSIRVPEGPPPLKADREPVLTEIVEGLRVVTSDPILRGLTAGTMGLSAMWGVVGAGWLLYATDDLGLDPAVIGVVAALGGFGSLLGAVVAGRVAGRFGVGRVVLGSLVVAALATMLIPLAPAGAPLVAVAFLLAQQLVGDSAITVFDVTEVSVRQARVPERQLGRVNGTVHTAAVVAQLTGTILGGVVGALFGLRIALLLGPLGVVVGLIGVWASPVRRQRSVEPATDAAA
jgi:predicted MFS family arabinose efflux permease